MSGLGRVYRPDPGDDNYRMERLIPEVTVTSGQKLWEVPYLYDQGQTPKCVGFSCSTAMTGMIAALLNHAVASFDAAGLYAWANAHDGDSTPHDGSTVRAGLDGLCKVGDQVLSSSDQHDEAVGVMQKITNYLWADTSAANADIDRLIQWLLTVSPVVIGINWTKDMSTPDANGFIHPTGDVAGGHAICVRGVNADDPNNVRFVLRNTWGSWGVTVHDDWSVDTQTQGGDALISKADLVSLLSQQGEAGALVMSLAPAPSPDPVPPAPPVPTPTPQPSTSLLSNLLPFLVLLLALYLLTR